MLLVIQYHIGINRNIVECKYEISAVEQLGKYGINRNIVECKFYLQFFQGVRKNELIETLWNVNSYQKNIYNRKKRGINRNIVECKSQQSTVIEHIRSELIETLWNVN